VSIIGIRKSFEKKGCQIALIVVCFAAMLGIAGVMTLQGIKSLLGFETNTSQTDPRLNEPAFSALGTEITMGHYLDRVTLMEQNTQQANTPRQIVNNYGGAASGDIALLATRNLAAKYGATVSEDDAIRYRTQEIDQQLMIMRMQISVNPNLPQGATDEQIDAAFLEEHGGSAGDIRREAIDNFKAILDDPATRAQVLEQYLLNALATAYAARVTVTEEELKATFDQFNFNRLVISPSLDPGADTTEQAEKAREELAGGASFASVYRKYSGDEGDAPTSFPMNRRTLEGNTNLTELLELAPGEVSQVISDFSGPTIYQLISVENEIPENFEENKETLMANLRTTKGNAQLTKEVDELSDPTLITWSSDAVQVLYEGFDALSKDPDNDKMLDLLARAEEARVGAISELDRPLACLRYELYTSLSRTLSATESIALDEEKEAILGDVLAYIESLQIRIELSDHFYFLEMNDDGFGELLSAARNVAGYDFSAPTAVTQLKQRFDMRKTAELISEEQETKFNEAIADIEAEIKLREEDEAEQAKADEEARIELDEFNRKQQEEADAEEAAAKAAAEGSGDDAETEGDSTDESGS
jgi:hypothetical protein